MQGKGLIILIMRIVADLISTGLVIECSLAWGGSRGRGRGRNVRLDSGRIGAGRRCDSRALSYSSITT